MDGCAYGFTVVGRFLGSVLSDNLLARILRGLAGFLHLRGMGAVLLIFLSLIVARGPLSAFRQRFRIVRLFACSRADGRTYLFALSDAFLGCVDGFAYGFTMVLAEAVYLTLWRDGRRRGSCT